MTKGNAVSVADLGGVVDRMKAKARSGRHLNPLLGDGVDTAGPRSRVKE